MELGTRKYDIGILKRLRVIPGDRETIAFLRTEDYYVDLQNAINFCEYNTRLHRKENTCFIEDFKQTIYKNGLEVMLLDANGELNTKMGPNKIFSILDMAKKIENLSIEDSEKFDKIAKEVFLICANELGIYGEQRDEFEYLLTRFVYVELINMGLSGNEVVISKIDSFIDYKLNRILKFLKIDLDLSSIKDFQIKYNSDKVMMNDKVLLNLNKEVPESNVRIYIRK